MGKFLLYLIAFLFLSVKGAIASTQQELQEVCQLTIDMNIMDKYFHEELAERKPLSILKNTYIELEPPLVKFGESVQYISHEELEANQRPYLEFSKIIINKNAAHVEFLYPIEGVEGRVKLLKDEHGWHIKSHKIIER
jgi:hypothetical protein